VPGEHAEQMQIDPAALQILSLAKNSFLKESEPAGDAAAAVVLRRTADLNAVQVIRAESFRDDSAAGCRYDSFSFVGPIDPITDAGVGVPLIDTVHTDGPNKHVLPPNSGSKSDPGGMLSLAVDQKPACVVQCMGRRSPRKPSVQTLKVAPDRIKQFLRIGKLQFPQRGIVIQTDYE
jgi:hypothetical protein